MIKKIVKYRNYYILLTPTLLIILVLYYLPYYGLQIAFKDFKIFLGVENSDWVGFKHFVDIFTSNKFPQVLVNTLKISFSHLIFGFPIPIIFALLLNEVAHFKFKKLVQTVTYFPQFLSWVVFAGMVLDFFGPLGAVNSLITGMGGEPVSFLTDPRYFISVLVMSASLKGFGWGAIVYLASLSGIDKFLYDAATVDGAGKLRQLWHVTLPGLRSTIVLLLVLQISNILNAGFDQVFMLYNPAVLEVSDIIDTYVYRVGLAGGQYEVATATGLFKGVVGLVLMTSANALSRKMEGTSIW